MMISLKDIPTIQYANCPIIMVKNIDLGFVGSCMVHKGDIKIVSKMLRNLEELHGKVKFKAPLVVTAPTYNIIDELKDEGDWEILQKYSGFEFDDSAPKIEARTEYDNILYLEKKWL